MDSHVHDTATILAVTNIATMIRTSAPQAMTPAEKPEKIKGVDFKRCQNKIFFYLIAL